jgi:hypothetical protein
MPNFQGNPMQLNLSGVGAAPYVQPGAPCPGDNYALDLDARSCPYDGSPCKRIGSNRFNWICAANSHQFDVSDTGVVTLLSSWPLVGMTSGVRTEPR